MKTIWEKFKKLFKNHEYLSRMSVYQISSLQISQKWLFEMKKYSKQNVLGMSIKNIFVIKKKKRFWEQNSKMLRFCSKMFDIFIFSKCSNFVIFFLRFVFKNVRYFKDFSDFYVFSKNKIGEINLEYYRCFSLGNTCLNTINSIFSFL